MNPLSQIAKSLVRKSGEASTAPFYSAIDKSLSSLPNKALGDQFIKEMLKSGVKPQEIIDRNIDVILGSPIVKKTRTVKLKKPDKKGRTEIEEKYFEVTPSAKGSKAIKREDVERIAAENPAPSITEKVEKGPSEAKYWVEHDDLNDRYDVVDDYNNVVKSFRDYDDAESYATKLTGGTTLHEQWQLPGGKNYREIKLMLPSFRPSIKNMGRKEYNEAIETADKMGIKDFQSSHFDEPNILAHARVSDRIGPNGEKILHIEEIQSDWHQKGRKKGYQTDERKAATAVDKGGYYEVRDQHNNFISNVIHHDMAGSVTPENALEIANQRIQFNEIFNQAPDPRVPDAPFKQNWHELVMKRLLDDAAKNGYDKVVITPGIEQVKRYPEAMRNIADEIVWNPIDQESKAITMRKNGFSVFSAQVDNKGIVTQSEVPEAIGKSLDELIGKNMAEQAIKNPAGEIKGKDFTVGGKGMEGFYDQMLPAFLNDYGKKWGVKVGTYDLPAGEKMIPVHSFDITPQMREDIVGKGQPLYQAIPAGVGAGTLAAPQEEVPDQPMKKGGAVHLSEGGEPETPEQQFEHYLRMLRINASGGKDKHGSSVGGRFGVNIPVAKDVFIEPFVQGFVFKPDTGKLMSGGVGGANLNIRFKNGGDVSEDAMRLAVLNKKIQHKAGGGKMEVLKAIGRGLRGMREPKNQTNIIKEGGGNWLAGNVEGALKPLKREDVSVSKPDPLNQWVDKQLTRYIKNQMGTKEDPIRASADKGILHYEPRGGAVSARTNRKLAGLNTDPISTTPYGMAWENVADAAISGAPYRMHLPMISAEDAPDALRALGGEFAFQNPNALAYSMNKGITTQDLGFNHLIDELRNAINPASGLPRELLIKPELLSKLSVPQAVERVAKINEWRAAQKAEADLLRARNPATVMHKEYPEGYSWYELKMPESRDTVKGHQTSGEAAYKQLQEALKYEGEQMGHCVGGYCPDVAEGRSRIYSLRDKKGQPHVTIEVKPQKQSDVDSIEWINENAARGALEAGEINNLNDWKDASQEVKDWYLDLAKKSFDAEFKPNLLPPSITQIKGKSNLAPKEKYLPFVQDFVMSGNWSDVRDLENAGLMRVDLLKKAGWDLGDINKKYLTKQEFEDIERGMYNSMKPTYGSTDEGMKRGGFIKFDNKNIDAMRMAVMNKQLRKRHG